MVKTVRVKEKVWRELMDMKVKTGKKSMSDVIKNLIENRREGCR